MTIFNLLNPEEAQRQYRNNIGRSIEAYSPTHLVVAEAMQNALDAITQLPGRQPEGHIHVSIDFNTVSKGSNFSFFSHIRSQQPTLVMTFEFREGAH